MCFKESAIHNHREMIPASLASHASLGNRQHNLLLKKINGEFPPRAMRRGEPVRIGAQVVFPKISGLFSLKQISVLGCDVQRRCHTRRIYSLPYSSMRLKHTTSTALYVNNTSGGP